jgi:hypothetical protein
MLCSIDEAVLMVLKGSPLAISGSEELLSRLPRGNWIGGTTAHIMTEQGGVETRDQILITPMPEEARLLSIQRYGIGGMHYLPSDAPERGFTIVILPFSSFVHQAFVKALPAFKEMSEKVIVGWVSGASRSAFGSRPKIFYGPIGHVIEDEMVAMHLTLPESLQAHISVISLNEPGTGDAITFLNEGFTVTHALVNGEMVCFAEYLRAKWSDPAIPIVCDYNGTHLTVDIKNYDLLSGHVEFYAPVFKNITYHFAKPVENYSDKLREAVQKKSLGSPFFECICIKNYELLSMGRDLLGAFEGPVSNGEIAHFLTNQSIVRLSLVGKDTVD